MPMRMVDVICKVCGHEWETLIRNIDEPAMPYCCGQMTERLYKARRQAVVQDTIEGGIAIEHGICNEDGTPKVYYHRSEIADACKAKGLVPWSEVYAEDRTKDARVQMDWQRSGEARRQKADRSEMRREGVRIDAPAQRPAAPRDERVARVAKEVVGARSYGEARERAERVARDVFRR